MRQASNTKTISFIGKNYNGIHSTRRLGIAANLIRRRYLGIDQEEKFIEISKKRREELENLQTYYKYRSKIKDIQIMDTMYPSMLKEDSDITYGDLPF